MRLPQSRLGLSLVLLAACLGERPLGSTSLGGSAGNANVDAGGSGASTAGSSPGGGSSGAVTGDGGVTAPQLEFEPLPSAMYSSTPLGPVTVQIVDADGSLVRGADDTITLGIGNNAASADLIGYLSVAAREGIAVFDTIGLTQPGTGFTLTASAAGFDVAISPAFDVARLPFERVVTGLYGGIVSHVAISNDDPSLLYASGPGGVFRSNDGGGSWVAASFGIPGAVGLIAIDPRNSARVYGTPAFGNVSYGATGALVVRSDDGGEAWRSLAGLSTSGVDGTEVGAFAIDPQAPNIVYAGNIAGVFRSTDAGESWVQTSFPYANFALTIDPIAPTTLYASAFDTELNSSRGIYKTVDSGRNWVPVNNASLPPDFTAEGPQALLAAPTGVFANRFRSTDGGASWVMGNASARAYAYARSDVQRVYAAQGAFVRVSNDGGVSFSPDTSPNAPINSLAVDPENPDRVYAATDLGVFVSTDAAATWASSSFGITTPLLYAAAMNPEAPDNVHVGGRGGVYTTNNGGVTWRYTELGAGIDEVTALRVDPVDPSIVYACTAGAFFHRSEDAGLNWSSGTDTGGTVFCEDITVSGSTLWVPTTGGIRRSTDGGTSWDPDSTLDLPCYSVTAAPGGATLYAGCSEGTYKSVNGGVDWTLMTLDLAQAFLIDPVTPSTVYMGLGCGDMDVATGSGGTRRSTNAGNDWGAVVPGACITSLIQRSDGHLLAAGRGSPAFAVSADQGLSWQAAGLGLAGDPTDVTASRDGQILYVPTTLGLYRSLSGGL